MRKSRTKKETVHVQKQPSNIPLVVIIFLLSVQTVFLFYKNSGLIRDFFRSDPNLIYQQETELKEHSNDFSNINPSFIKISVLNGCGVPGIAATWRERLRRMEFDVRETGNASRRYERTIVLSRTEDMTYAKYLANKLNIDENNVYMQLNRDLVDIDLTVIIGADYQDFED